MANETLGTITEQVIGEAELETGQAETVRQRVLQRFDLLADTGMLSVQPGEEVTMNFSVASANVLDVREVVDEIVGDLLNI